MAQAADVEVMVKKVVDTYDRLDYAFNNAGIEGVVTPTVAYGEADWGRTSRGGYMSTKEPFTISIPDDVLTDLRDRLTRTRWPQDFANDGWEYGTNGAYLKELAA